MFLPHVYFFLIDRKIKRFLRFVIKVSVKQEKRRKKGYRNSYSLLAGVLTSTAIVVVNVEIEKKVQNTTTM